MSSNSDQRGVLRGKSGGPGTLDAWVDEASGRKRRCCVCKDEARDVPDGCGLVQILAAINAKKAFKVSVPKIYEKLCSENAGFEGRVGFNSVRMHLTLHHEPTWHRTKSRAK